MLLLGGLFVYQIGYRPLPSEDIEVVVASWASAENMELKVETLRILSLNLNHGAGTQHLDVEHGDFKELSVTDVESALDRVVELARAERADVVLLQSVDFGSRFAGELDQADYIADKLKFGYLARARMWKHPYLPFPDPLGGRMLGSVDTGLAIISRLPLSEVKRFSLPRETLDNWWRSTFATNHGVLVAELTAKDKHLLLFNTLLTSGNLVERERQAREVARLVGQETSGFSILAGTFFAAPKDASQMGKKRLDYTLDLIRHRMNFQALFTDREALTDPAGFATYLDPDGNQLMVDYVLAEKGLNVKSLRILQVDPPLSTHRPLILELIL